MSEPVETEASSSPGIRNGAESVLSDVEHISELAQTYEQSLGISAETQTQLALEAALDPRSKEFQDAIRFTPATLATYRTKGRWNPADHLLYVSSILASEIARGDARIIVEMPPRHGKSELISVHTPVWFLEHYPWANVILTTYAADLATGFGRRVRDAFLDDDAEGGDGFLRTKVRGDVQRTDHFLTTAGGGMASVGIGGPITGRGAHLLIVDDYIKNWVEASSAVTLESIWEWFRTTAYTRLEPGGSCVILATRWASGDLIDRLKEQDKRGRWRVIRLPAFAEEGDPLGRTPGTALWPRRYTIQALQDIADVLGDFIFSAMYQQSPKNALDTKADINKIQYIDAVERPHTFRWTRSWDIAATKEGGDWTAGALVGLLGRPGSVLSKTVVADLVHKQWSPADLEKNIRATAESDGPGISIVIEQEPGAAGKAYATYLAENVLSGFNVTIQPATGANKWIKAQPYVAAVSSGRIYMVKAAWNAVHTKELKDFPNVKHDDTVDAVAQGYNQLHLTAKLAPTWGRDPSSVGTLRGDMVPDPGRSSPGIRVDRGKLIRGATWGRPRSAMTN